MVEPYLNLEGRAMQAIELYKTVFKAGGERVMRVGDMNPGAPEAIKNQVAHAQMEIRGTNFNFSDMQPNVAKGGNISLMVRFDSEDELRQVYEQLREGGFTMMELMPQPYARAFAWIADPFGVGWQLIYE